VKEVPRVHKGYRGRKEKEVTPEARVSPVLKVCRGLQGQKVKKAIPAHRARQDARAREATLVARACPVLKAPRDLRGQKVSPADLSPLQQLEASISDWKSDRLRQGRSWSRGRRAG